MALFNPFRYEINPYRNYDINKLRDRFRSLKILKNRDGNADKIIGLEFLGEIGHFKELPLPKDMTNTEYERIMNIKKYIR